jgi:SnoaL-like protein
VSADHQEISNVMFRYAELLNLGEVDEVAQLFRYGRITSSGSDDVHEGPEAVAGWYRRSVRFPDRPPDTLLFTTNVQIYVDGDEATARSYFAAVHSTTAGLAPIVAGRYHDGFRRIDGRWWFDRRHMIVDLVGDTGDHVKVAMDRSDTDGDDHERA